MPSEGRNTASALRKLADMSERGMPDDELGPILWLLSRTMMKRARKPKP
jgi:hypothetical protein